MDLTIQIYVYLVFVCVFMQYSEAASVRSCTYQVSCNCPYGTVWSTDMYGCRVCSCKVMCPIITCPANLSCPSGFNKDANGCSTCTCKQPACPLLDCLSTTSCPRGHARDADGCPTCSCNQYGCLQVTCTELSCPNGLARDSNGCQECTCKPPSSCPPNNCPQQITCPFGFAKDANNCKTCTCNSPKCPLMLCPPAICPHGFETDVYGCQICKCKQLVCPELNCSAVSCPNGFISDDKGCQTCNCSPVLSTCPFICLHMSCPHGIEQDVNGCPLCKCKHQHVQNSGPESSTGVTQTPGDDSQPLCADCPGTECSEGFIFDTDANGCKTNCTCKSDSSLCADVFCHFFCLQPLKYFDQIVHCSCDCSSTGHSNSDAD